MEKRLRQLGKSLSPASLGMGLKAPPPKRTRSQTKHKTTSAVEGLTTPLQSWAISTDPFHAETFHELHSEALTRLNDNKAARV